MEPVVEDLVRSFVRAHIKVDSCTVDPRKTTTMIAHLRVGKRTYTTVAAAKCSPVDNFSMLTGLDRAFRRAVTQITQAMINNGNGPRWFDVKPQAIEQLRDLGLVG